MSGGSRVSIPNSVRKTIQNIKEIAGNHSDEEIYAMLRECSMDPNETAQKLLLQDPFHEVKRKRDKKKESNREPADARWRPGSQGRGGRGGRGNYSSRYVSHDAGGGRNVEKESGTNQGTEKGITSASVPPSQETENRSNIPKSSPVVVLSNGPTKVENTNLASGPSPEESGACGTAIVEEHSGSMVNKMGASPVSDAKSSASRQHVPNSDLFLPSKEQSLVCGIYASDSDPVLVPSLDERIPGNVGTIKHEVGSQWAAGEMAASKVVSCDVDGSELSSLRKGSSETNHSYIHGKMRGKSQGFEGNQLPDTSQGVSSSRTSSAGSRPSSNYGSRSLQLSGSLKAVGPAMEWKPKSTNVIPGQASETHGTSVVESKTGQDAAAYLVPTTSYMDSEGANSMLQKKLEELQFSETQHVIIPNHLQVPESERTGLSFGSFDANFGLTTKFVNDPESDKSSTQLSESSQEIEENVEEPNPIISKASPTTQQAIYPTHPQTPEQMVENLSSREPGISSSTGTVSQYDQSKPETPVAPESAQYSVVHTAPTYSNFGPVQQMLGSHFGTFDGAEPQAHDASRLPSFVVQQPFDPSSYYTSMFRPTADNDGRFSPFLTPGAAAKYNGNIAVLPVQAGQSLQESGNSLVLPSAGQSSLVTQAAGMQGSVPGSQQSVPVFRQPATVQISHFPPNYIPYNQYFSPYYVPPGIHPFLSNAAFPPQLPTGSIYSPSVGAAGAAPVKYSISQYKPSTNTGNTTHVGMPTGYGAFSPTAVTSGNSSSSEDLNSSQYKENNVFIAGQQSEASAVWVPTPGRDVSAIQATSFYNLPPQGHQHITFAPTQASHGAFPGIYPHPTQTVAAGAIHPMLQQSQAMAGTVEMVGPPGGIYQQPQRAQINWVNNY